MKCRETQFEQKASQRSENMATPFTNEDRRIMQKHNVPYLVAYNRVDLLKWDKQRAITEKLHYGKGRRKREFKIES